MILDLPPLPPQTKKNRALLMRQCWKSGQRERVCLGSSVVVFGGDASDEALDVQLGGARLLAGGVGALQASGCLPQGAALAQRRMLDVLEVVPQVRIACSEQKQGK